MTNKILKPGIIFLIFTFLNLVFAGCYPTSQVSMNESGEFRIKKLEMKNGEIIEFNQDDVKYARFVNNEILIYYSTENTIRTIPLNEVKKVYKKELNKFATYAFVTAGFIVVVFSFILYISIRSSYMD